MQSFNVNGFKPSLPDNSNVTNLGFGSFLVSLFQNNSLKLLGAGVSVILFVAVISLSYSLGVRDVEKGAVPIIVSDGSPVKIRPQNPGGKQFPYQDISIYKTLRGEKPNDSVILAEAPEQPLEFSPAEQMNLQNTSSTNLANNQAVTDPSNNKAQFANLLQDSTRVQSVEKVTKSLPNSFVEKKQIDLPVQNVPVPNPADKVKDIISLTNQPITPPPAAGVAPYLQIGAYRSDAEARGAWQKISSKFSNVLKNGGYIVAKADIAGKGTFYRLRVGPYNNKDDAKTVCQSLMGKGQGCMFVMQ